MTNREALYRCIVENRWDDGPRLIFADYLEENGESAYAQFIRDQVVYARLPKVPRVRVRRLRAVNQYTVIGRVSQRLDDGRKYAWLTKTRDGSSSGYAYPIGSMLVRHTWSTTFRLCTPNEDDERRDGLRHEIQLMWKRPEVRAAVNLTKGYVTLSHVVKVPSRFMWRLVVRCGFVDTVMFGHTLLGTEVWQTALERLRLAYPLRNVYVPVPVDLSKLPADLHYSTTWTTRDGCCIHTSDMTTSHLHNTLAWIKRGNDRFSRYAQFIEHELRWRGEHVPPLSRLPEERAVSRQPAAG